MAEDSSCIAHEPCPKCGSQDNLGRYTDGHGFCFGCGYYDRGAGEADGERPDSPAVRSLVPGEAQALASRRLTEETCRKFGYLVGEARHPKTKQMEPVQIATYRDETGRAVAQKLRWRDKSFQFVGEPKKAGLYGQHLWRDKGKRVVVTEGELDALSVSQLQQNKWPVVSVPNGAQGAKKSLAAALEWLDGFDEVVLMFDDDDAGREAAEACAPLFKAGKCKVARIDGHKDASDALVAGHGTKVIDAIWGAKEYRPDGIIGMDAIIDKASQPIEFSTMTWPWPTMDRYTYGRRFTELYALAAGTGMGKTTVFKQWQAHVLANDKDPIGVFSLEEPPHHSMRTLAGVIDGVRYHVPGVKYDPDKLVSTLRSLEGKVYVYDHVGGAEYETIIEKMRYMRHAFGVRHFFLDNLTALAAVMGEDNERKAIDRMMVTFSSLMQELDSCLYFISHLNTPEGKSHEEGGRVKENQLRGSRSIAFSSNFIFAVEGDKQSIGEPRTFRILKDRNTGDGNGITFGLQYDRNTGRLVECSLDDSPFEKETARAAEDF